MAKDEEGKIGACIESALPHVDSFVLMDTGCTDGTIEEAQDAWGGGPGQFYSWPWENFAANRTQLLEYAGKWADYVLMLDADHIVTTKEPLPELTADSYLIQIEDAWGGWLPLLTKSGLPFSYEGAAHAYLKCAVAVREEKLHAISIKGGDGATEEKLRRDLEALKQAVVDDPTDARSVFYLAQTYRDLDMIEEAIRYYRLRAEMSGFAEETYFARYQLGVLLCEHVSFEQGAPELLAAWKSRPHRAEALRALSNAAGNVADKIPFPEEDALFVQRHLYR